ncbi:MAG: ATP-binding protein [Oscillospiraceae bacterium]|nr:ATP-binding protein [Oscillospiraceae bacterium]
MKKRLFLYTTLIIFVGIVSFFALTVYITYENNLKIAKSTVEETTEICAGMYNSNTDISEFVKVGKDTRITIISPDGSVLADTLSLDMEKVENHLQRPEVQAAVNGIPTAYVRYSATHGIDYIYYALKTQIGEGDNDFVFVRTAVPVSEMKSYFYNSLPMLVLILIVVIGLCFILIRSAINLTTRPFNSIQSNLRLLSSGKYTLEPIVGSYDEIDDITKEINEIAIILQENFNSLRDEKNKSDFILNNIGDAIFAVDPEKNIVLINNSALEIFNVTADIIGKSLAHLSFNETIMSAVEDSLTHSKTSLLEVLLFNRIYSATVKMLPELQLTMIIMSDVTEIRENAKRREEFFANASHELKTPLTAIKGFSELAAINNKDEGINKFIDSIMSSTERMLNLIGDMLNLSKLESGNKINPESVMLSKTITEVRELISTAINEKAIVFEVKGDVQINCEPEHLYELVKNLIENAVRYNNVNGLVSISIEENKIGNPCLCILDNGIGIPQEEQHRIFERFYRVEKSRSQLNGGTGLGLSIVKHICALYGWNLSLKSKLGVGTEIRVEFTN